MIVEKCGIIAIYGEYDELIGSKAFEGLCSLQHRGQEGAGVAIFSSEVQLIKQYGLVKNVFAPYDNLSRFGGEMALGHVLYGHEGETEKDIQPTAISTLLGTLYLAYNGCITNRDELIARLPNYIIDHEDKISDIECIGYTLKYGFASGLGIISALKLLHELIKGSFCLIAVIDKKIYCIRDKYGFRPMCFGRSRLGQYVFASETCALSAIDAIFEREVRPGEIIVCDGTSVNCITAYCGKVPCSLCCFEYIYFADRNSVIGGNLVTNIRHKAGKLLAKKAPAFCDVVIGVPDSGMDAAKGFAEELGLPYSNGFFRNEQIHRTFIVPHQIERQRLVQEKLTVIKDVVNGKDIVVVDDSIVRGTTMTIIAKLLRKAGAKKIHIRISSPRFIFGCPYGTDIGARETFIAHNRTNEEIADLIGVDSLSYLEPADINTLIGDGCPSICKACFDGKYPDMK